MRNKLNSSKLKEVFDQLRAAPKASNVLLAAVLQKESGVYAACTSDNELVLLIRDGSKDTVPTRELTALRVDYGMVCRAQIGTEEVEEKVIFLKLNSESSNLEEAFFLIVAITLEQFERDEFSQSPRDLVDNLIRLFQSRPGESREALVGLFGELKLIDESANPDIWAQAWHSKSNSNKDFTFSSVLVEVKTAESRHRKHRISLEQLTGDDKPVQFVSVRIEESPLGSSIMDVLGSLEAKLTRDLYRKILELFFETLGLANNLAKNLTFELIGGASSILVVNSRAVPAPELPSRTERAVTISGVSFESNFDLIVASAASEGTVHLITSFANLDASIQEKSLAKFEF